MTEPATQPLTPEEIEGQQADLLPDREAMSLIDPGTYSPDSTATAGPSN